MTVPRPLSIILLLLMSSLACSVLAQPAATPAPVLADSFFSGRAYIDANGNGRIDDTDLPLEGARFSAEDARGANGGGQTDKDGNAMAWWPGETVYPVTLHMQPPEGSDYRLVGRDEIILNEGVSSEFLFSKPGSP